MRPGRRGPADDYMRALAAQDRHQRRALSDVLDLDPGPDAWSPSPGFCGKADPQRPSLTLSGDPSGVVASKTLPICVGQQSPPLPNPALSADDRKGGTTPQRAASLASPERRNGGQHSERKGNPTLNSWLPTVPPRRKTGRSSHAVDGQGSGSRRARPWPVRSPARRPGWYVAAVVQQDMVGSAPSGT